jgi:intraflagellar transport protein 140
MTVVVSDTNVYSVEGDVVQVRNFQGIIKQSLSFTEVEGAPLLLDICKSFLVVGTFNGYIKLWDISRREAKQHFSAKCMAELIESFAGLVSIKCNCTGTRISVIANQVDRGKAVPSPQIYIWDADLDTLLSFDFSTASNSSNGTEDDDCVVTGREELVKDVRDRYPVSHYWDGSDSRLLICEAKRLSERDKPNLVASKTDTQSETFKGVMVVSLFATPENGVLLHDSIPLDSKYTGLIGIDIPYLYFCKKVAHVDNQPSTITSHPQDSRGQLAPLETMLSPQTEYHMIAQRPMRDFAGLEDSDTAAKTAMMDFSYYVTVGNMDEAFKAIKLIKSESVWENMARMCVKTKRLDVAFVCLGNMGHARGAKALRQAMKEPEVDARVAMLAIQLGMKEEAEALYKSCGRHDLLNQLYQAQDKWTESVHVAETNDRVHLRTTYYNFAQHSEASGDLPAAINAYEKSDTHRTEVPRLLYDDPSDLEGYVLKSKDRALHRWWAQYLESTGDMDNALQFYDAAHDYVSLVRVLCYCSRIDHAVEVANDSGDKAASYHLARQFENMVSIQNSDFCDV